MECTEIFSVNWYEGSLQILLQQTYFLSCLQQKVAEDRHRGTVSGRCSINNFKLLEIVMLILAEVHIIYNTVAQINTIPSFMRNHVTIFSTQFLQP